MYFLDVETASIFEVSELIFVLLAVWLTVTAIWGVLLRRIVSVCWYCRSILFEVSGLVVVLLCLWLIVPIICRSWVDVVDWHAGLIRIRRRISAIVWLLIISRISIRIIAVIWRRNCDRIWLHRWNDRSYVRDRRIANRRRNCGCSVNLGLNRLRRHNNWGWVLDPLLRLCWIAVLRWLNS